MHLRGQNSRYHAYLDAEASSLEWLASPLIVEIQASQGERAERGQTDPPVKTTN
jgi:hypothetical protein